jgi:competence protein ComEC
VPTVATVPTASPVKPVSPPRPDLAGSIWRAPLVLAALALSAGFILDRFFSPPLAGSLFSLAAALVAWVFTILGRSRGLPLVYLTLALAALGAVYHHTRRDIIPPDDVSLLVREHARIVQLRGMLDEEPSVRWHPQNDPLQSVRQDNTPRASTVSVLRVTACRLRDDWLPASGRAQMLISGALEDFHDGDGVELTGLLMQPAGPTNPGERDLARALADRRIRAIVRVENEAGALVRLQEGGPLSTGTWRARLRAWGLRALEENLPERQTALAAALLLGEGSRLDRREWDKYVRTGVIHVLVISGQHLIILAGFLWTCLWLFQVRRRRGILLVLALLWLYAFVAGFRPPVLRAVITVTAPAIALMIRRPIVTANAFALAWLAVILIEPADISNTGCLLSFLCVGWLFWNHHRERETRGEMDPLERLLEESRPRWQKGWLWAWHRLRAYYLITLGLWLVVAPLVIARNHFVPVMGLILGPPVVLFTALALGFGFAYLLACGLLLPVAPLLAWPVRGSLAVCEWLVDLGDRLWTRQGYVPDLPAWWLSGYYLLLCGGLLWARTRRHWRWTVLVGLAWLCLGLLAGTTRFASSELRMTFLSVGHGSCTVLETPDGRTLLYDAGSLKGPGVVRFQIAPYLWHRGVRRIDEVFLSHADLDHFNGLRDLLDRFTVGQVTTTPTFRARNNAAVREVMAAVDRAGVPIRVVSRGDRLEAGVVTMDVLHPPRAGPEGVENVRSLVLLIRHGRHRFLLTGDLEGVGLAQMLGQPHRRVDVLMAPHHGSRKLDAGGLMAWARPKVVVSCQGPARYLPVEKSAYEAEGVRFLPTSLHGAVTVRSHTSGLVVETFVTGEQFVVPPTGEE